MYTLEFMRDLLMDKADQAIKIRLPGEGDVTQIPFLAFDRALVQGPKEPNASFVARLKGAFAAWDLAGSRVAVLAQLQAYLQGLQPGVSASLPEVAIVGGYYSTVATWDTIYQGDAIGKEPTHASILPSNFNWDGQHKPWRAWLILYMALVASGLSGSSGQTSTAAAGSYSSPGQNVAGVWVPATSGAVVNHPWITLTGLAGLSSADVGQWITMSGSGHAGNNGSFPIVSVSSGSSCVIANPNGVASDTGPLTWSIGAYPFIGPGPVWGAPGYVFGQGQLQTPPLSTGANVNGTWQPSLVAGATYGAAISWGLNVPATTIQTIRSITKRWKSAATWYVNLIVAFDGGTGSAGSAYSPNSTPGSGNPDGTFGSVGTNVAGVWVPTRTITSRYDVYCQGTGTYVSCSEQNST